MSTRPRSECTRDRQVALQRAVTRLVQARPQRSREIADAVRLLLDSPVPIDDGIQFADGVVVRRPNGACTHPSCQAQITCGHELAFQLAQDIPALVRAPEPDPPQLAPTPGAFPCRHCGLLFTDLSARRCHQLAEHLRPDAARETRILFLRHRLALASAATKEVL
jgi:hypothetical protein